MNKKVLWILCAFLALLIGATVLYNALSDDVQMGGLATQPPAAPAESEAPAPSVPESSVPETSVPAQTTEPVDYSAPDFTVQDWEGNAVKLSEFEGKPVILNFWASWCGPCKSEMPDFQEKFDAYGEEIHFLMVNCTGGRETLDSAKTFIEEQGYTFPVYFDTTYEAASVYGASSIPMTFFIDAEGNLVTYGMGALSADLLQTGIDMIYEPEVTE